MDAFELRTTFVEALYVEHHGWLRNWLGKKLGNAGDAADIAHDTYLRVLSTGNRFPDAESRRFLTQIANGLVIDLYRRRRIEAAYLEVLAGLPPAESPSEETRAIIVDALVQIDALLHRLPEKTRLAFLMYKIDGMTYGEIAVRLGVSVSSVERYVAHALISSYEALHGQLA